jgi:osmotically inducible lipoprotein OsmB
LRRQTGAELQSLPFVSSTSRPSEKQHMKTYRLLGLIALALTLTACGHNMEQRAATGAIAGAVVAGPVGAVAGAAVGAAVDKAADAD